MRSARKPDRRPFGWQTILIGRRPAATLRRAALLAVASLIFFSFIAQPVFIRGASMEPTYRDGGVRLANVLRYRFHEPERGDVVVIAMAGRRAMYMKRILALPGETVLFSDGDLIVNGERLPEPYVLKSGTWNTPVEILGANEYYVAGDNRSMPVHEHVMGTVERSRIIGKMLL